MYVDFFFFFAVLATSEYELANETDAACTGKAWWHVFRDCVQR